MQALSDRLFENKTLMFSAAAVAFFVAALLILLVFRMAFGRRLRMPWARARQPRLGIVDAFDLDRQRQLVIVRRDNVEHLLMIGGPNDVVIESEIVRVEGAREPRMRDKEVEGKPPATGAVPLPEPAAVNLPPVLPPIEVPPPAEAPPPLAPAARAPIFPLPPRRSPSPLPPPSFASRLSAARDGGAPESGEGDQPQTARPPSFLRPMNRPVPPLSTKPPVKPPEKPADAPPVLASPPSSDLPPAPPVEPVPLSPEPPAPTTQADHIDTLEEEMAKLLGRGPSKG